MKPTARSNLPCVCQARPTSTNSVSNDLPDSRPRSRDNLRGEDWVDTQQYVHDLGDNLGAGLVFSRHTLAGKQDHFGPAAIVERNNCKRMLEAEVVPCHDKPRLEVERCEPFLQLLVLEGVELAVLPDQQVIRHEDVEDVRLGLVRRNICPSDTSFSPAPDTAERI